MHVVKRKKTMSNVPENQAPSELLVNGHFRPFTVTHPCVQSRAGLILIPGASGGALSSRYDPVAMRVRQRGYALLRFESWKNAGTLGRKTLRDIRVEMDAFIHHLLACGYRKIGLIGKSLGGGLALASRNPHVRCMVLWAPAIGLAPRNNLERWMGRPLRDAEDFTDIALDQTLLKQHHIPIAIIQGTQDEVVSLQHAHALAASLPRAEVITVDGADHSFTAAPHQEQLIRKTLAFLDKHLPAP